MKKVFKTITLTLLATLAVFCFTACKPNNQENQVNPLIYEYTLNQTSDGYVLTKFLGDTNAGAVSVPAVIKDKPVTELGKNLFAGANFHTVNLPSSVAVIGDGAFSYCKNLLSVNTVNVKSFGEACFDSCSRLSTIDLSTATVIYAKAFRNCSSLTQVTIPSTCTALARETFSNCEKLKTVNLPSSVTTIREMAFSGCRALVNIDLSGVKYFGASAFNACSSLVSINLASAEVLNRSVFQSCGRLSNVAIGDNLICIYANAFVYDYAMQTLSLPDYDSTNKWISVDYNLQNPTSVWTHYLNTNKLKNPVSNVKSFTHSSASAAGNPKKDNYYCKKTYLEQYPGEFNVAKALEHVNGTCTCIENGLPDCNITINGSEYFLVDLNVSVGETVTFGAYLSYGDGVDTVDTKIEVTILSGANYVTVVNPEEGSTTLTSTVTFNRAIDDYVNVQVYCSATSTIVEFNFRVN